MSVGVVIHSMLGRSPLHTGAVSVVGVSPATRAHDDQCWRTAVRLEMRTQTPPVDSFELRWDQRRSVTMIATV